MTNESVSHRIAVTAGDITQQRVKAGCKTGGLRLRISHDFQAHHL